MLQTADVMEIDRAAQSDGEPNAVYADLVRDVEQQVAAFLGSVHSLLGIETEEEPNYYHSYPFLFREEFPSVDDTAITTLAVAGVFYLNHLCLVDDVVDSPDAPQIYKLFLSPLLHEEALKRLGTLFAGDSPFWTELSSYHREFAAAMLQEQARHTGKVTAFRDGEAFSIAKGKSALSKMTTTALALLAGRPETIRTLSASQDCFNAARQMYDDVKDWRADYLDRRYSSLLTAALVELGGGDSGLHAVSAQLHYGGHIDKSLTQAAAWCDEALESVSDLRVPGWVRLVHSLQAQVVRLRDDLARIREASEKRMEAVPE